MYLKKGKAIEDLECLREMALQARVQCEAIGSGSLRAYKGQDTREFLARGIRTEMELGYPEARPPQYVVRDTSPILFTKAFNPM